MSQAVNGDRLLLGRGKLYFDRFDANGDPTGERFLGNCTRVEESLSDEKRQRFSSATPDSALMKEVNIRRTVEIAITLDHFEPENIALALMGEVSTLTQGASTPTGEVIDVIQQGVYYKLANRDVSSVVVTDNPMTLTYAAGTDYVVDGPSGRLYIVPGGTIAAGSDILVDYSAGAISGLNKIIAATKNTIEGMIRFVGNPAAGPVLEAEIWKVSITPDGAIGFISDEFAEFPLKATVLDDSANHPTEPLWRVIEVAA